jgi:signal transduction histidine kinase
LRKERNDFEKLVVERTRELRELSHRLVDAQEKERANIGNALHDEIGQHLTYATLLIERASRKPDPQLLGQAKSSVQDAIAKMRNLSAMLSPRLLRSAGILNAVVSMTEEYRKSTNIKVDLDHDGILEDLPQDVALAGYRIIQESLTNAARHSKATAVKVRVSRESGRLHMEVADNGIGFDFSAVEHSTGLTGMKERALARGGELTVSSKHGQGTRVVATLPLSDQEKGS